MKQRETESQKEDLKVQHTGRNDGLLSNPQLRNDGLDSVPTFSRYTVVLWNRRKKGMWETNEGTRGREKGERQQKRKMGPEIKKKLSEIRKR